MMSCLYYDTMMPYYDVIALLMTGWWFSPGYLVSSTKKTDRHNIAEMLLRVALNTITLALITIGTGIIYISHLLGLCLFETKSLMYTFLMIPIY